jgi:hypothetical protein
MLDRTVYLFATGATWLSSSSDDENDKTLESCRLLFEKAESLVLFEVRELRLRTENRLGELSLWSRGG